MNFLQQEKQKYPGLGQSYDKLGDLFTKKLYHELTIALDEFVNDPSCSKDDNLIQLYNQFIEPIQPKLNQLKTMLICVSISKQYQDKAQALKFLENILSKHDERLTKEAKLVCQMKCSIYKLNIGKEYEGEIKALLEEKKEQVESLVGAEPVVHASYYDACCQYYLNVGPPDLYYKSALMLLAYSPKEDMDPKDRFNLATNISLAALTGDGVFNFGEILTTPILEVLKGTDKEWLSDLMNAFNRGDIDKFNEIMGTNHQEYDSQPALVNKREYIKEKVSLLALMELVFHCPSHERNIPFKTIAEETRLPLEQVEWLVMRAMSLKLIKGSIDQVEQIVRVSWVQPRVLDPDQIKELCGRLSEWGKKVKDILLFVEDQTPELFQ